MGCLKHLLLHVRHPGRLTDQIIQRIGRLIHQRMPVPGCGLDRVMAHQNSQCFNRFSRVRGKGVPQYVRGERILKPDLCRRSAHHPLEGIVQQMITNDFSRIRAAAVAGRRKNPEPWAGKWGGGIFALERIRQRHSDRRTILAVVFPYSRSVFDLDAQPVDATTRQGYAAIFRAFLPLESPGDFRPRGYLGCAVPTVRSRAVHNHKANRPTAGRGCWAYPRRRDAELESIPARVRFFHAGNFWPAAHRPPAVDGATLLCIRITGPRMPDFGSGPKRDLEPQGARGRLRTSFPTA